MVFQRSCDQGGAFELKFTKSAVEMIAEYLSPLNTPKLNSSYFGLRGSANYVLLEVTLEPSDNSNPVDPMPALCRDINTSNAQEIQGAAGDPLPTEVQDAAPLQVIDFEVSNIVQSSSSVSGSGTHTDERDVVAYVWGQEGDSRFFIYLTDIENNMFRIDNPEPWSDENNWPWIKVGLNPYEEDDEEWFNGIWRTIWVDVSGYDSANSQATLHVSINTTNEDLTCCSTNSQIGHFDDGLVAYYPLDGKTEDESGFANHGMEHGGLDYVQGIYGKAASFDGIDDTILVPHIASDDVWNTGLVAYNPAADSCTVTITAYTESGMSLDPQGFDIPPKGRYFGAVSQLDLPESTAWMKIEAQNPLAGFELFSLKSETPIAIAGYTGINLAKTKGTLPLLENDGSTGIAFVNVGEDNATVVVTALNDAGSEVDRTEVVLNPLQKYVGPISKLFEGNISRATYFTYASAKKVVMFQLNMSSDQQMLDALPGL